MPSETELITVLRYSLASQYLAMILLDPQLIRDRHAGHHHDAEGVKVSLLPGTADVENSEQAVVMIEDRSGRTGQIVIPLKEVLGADDLDRLSEAQHKSDRPGSCLFFSPDST